LRQVNERSNSRRAGVKSFEAVIDEADTVASLVRHALRACPRIRLDAQHHPFSLRYRRPARTCTGFDREATLA
jgi:hypothetical protein